LVVLGGVLGELTVGAGRHEAGDLVGEVVGRLELLVDAGESQVGDLVEALEGLEDREADLVGRDLRASRVAKRVLDLLAESRQVVVGDRSALAGLADTGDGLVTDEGLGGAERLTTVSCIC